MLDGYQIYSAVLQTIETSVEIAILYFIIKEGTKVVEKVTDIHDSTTVVHGLTDALQVGNRVHVLVPQPGKPREEWLYNSDIWVIREVDKNNNRATATPVLAPPEGVIPTVSGPMSGPLSPFSKAHIPS